MAKEVRRRNNRERKCGDAAAAGIGPPLLNLTARSTSLTICLGYRTEGVFRGTFTKRPLIVWSGAACFESGIPLKPTEILRNALQRIKRAGSKMSKIHRFKESTELVNRVGLPAHCRVQAEVRM